MTDTPLSLLEVAELCATIAATSDVLFEFAGTQVTVEVPGPRQRWWATACHRHGWHLELARDRMPTVPTVAAEHLVTEARAALEQRAADLDGSPGAALHRWHDAVEALSTTLEDCRARNDPTLDPATARLVQLVGDDLAALSSTADAWVATDSA